MHLICCIDDHGGMCFNRRRQSQDRAVRADILRECGGRPLWMNAYSGRQFAGEDSNRITVAEDFLTRAGEGDFCFVEDQPVRPYLERVEQFILYCWDRSYPADLFLDVLPAQEGWTLLRAEEFPGHSHRTITKEVYIR